jgi:hypothetical protein
VLIAHQVELLWVTASERPSAAPIFAPPAPARKAVAGGDAHRKDDPPSGVLLITGQLTSETAP